MNVDKGSHDRHPSSSSHQYSGRWAKEMCMHMVDLHEVAVLHHCQTYSPWDLSKFSPPRKTLTVAGR